MAGTRRIPRWGARKSLPLGALARPCRRTFLPAVRMHANGTGGAIFDVGRY